MYTLQNVRSRSWAQPATNKSTRETTNNKRGSTKGMTNTTPLKFTNSHVIPYMVWKGNGLLMDAARLGLYLAWIKQLPRFQQCLPRFWLSLPGPFSMLVGNLWLWSPSVNLTILLEARNHRCLLTRTHTHTHTLAKHLSCNLNRLQSCRSANHLGEYSFPMILKISWPPPER